MGASADRLRERAEAAWRAATVRARRRGEALGLGPLAVHLFHRPVGRVRAWARAGGPHRYRQMRAGQHAMAEAAAALPPLSRRPGGPAYDLAFLTGANWWYQTLFCFYSIQLHADVPLRPLLYDDGTLHPEHVALVRRAVPWAVVVSRDEVEARLDRELPEAAYPTLRARRR
ncbi:MAG: hypothetical protein R3362_03845, partial [Rhodothermales bacterium]|nr:hypothetical protein [Rhodothermales bacterium]